MKLLWNDQVSMSPDLSLSFIDFGFCRSLPVLNDRLPVVRNGPCQRKQWLVGFFSGWGMDDPVHPSLIYGETRRGERYWRILVNTKGLRHYPRHNSVTETCPFFPFPDYRMTLKRSGKHVQRSWSGYLLVHRLVGKEIKLGQVGSFIFKELLRVHSFGTQ